MSNINFKWLTKFDFKGSFKMSDNLPENDLDIAINDAYNFDVINTLPDALMDNIKAVLLINPIQWSTTNTYAVNDKVFYDGVYYKAVNVNTNSKPSAANTDWSEIQLMSFWTDYVKPYFLACAYYNFLNWHGANVTQYGLRQNQEDTSQEVSDKRKGELMASVSGKKDSYLARLTKRFNDVNKTFDEVVYEYDSTDTHKPNQGVRIWGVGKTQKKFYDNGRLCCPGDYNNSIDI
jgi:hypothetical protein